MPNHCYVGRHDGCETDYRWNGLRLRRSKTGTAKGVDRRVGFSSRRVSGILNNQPERNTRYMTIESIPKFTAPAAVLWATIPSDTQKRLLSNVWCGQCRHEVTITNFSGTVKAGDLLLVGKCSECQGDVARLIELNRTKAEAD